MKNISFLALFLLLAQVLFFIAPVHDKAAAVEQTNPTTSQQNDVTLPECDSSKEKCGFHEVLSGILRFMGFLVLPVCVIVIIWGGISYSAAGNNPEAINKARQRIAAGILALLTYILLYAFLNWLIPGGVEPELTSQLTDYHLLT